MRNLLVDFIVFVEILLYWLFVLVVMLPASVLDRLFRTRWLEAADRLTRRIARL